MATPFVQGRLRNQPLSVEVHTECAHCDQSIRLTIDSRMRVHVHQAEAAPLVFQPHINWNEFTEPNIIHAY